MTTEERLRKIKIYGTVTSQDYWELGFKNRELCNGWLAGKCRRGILDRVSKGVYKVKENVIL